MGNNGKPNNLGVKLDGSEMLERMDAEEQMVEEFLEKEEAVVRSKLWGLWTRSCGKCCKKKERSAQQQDEDNVFVATAFDAATEILEAFA